MTIFVVMGLILIALGLVQFLFPDALWRQHAWWKRFEGVTVERTPEWDTGRGCAGIFFLLFGLGMLAFGCAQRGEEKNRPPSDGIRTGPIELPPEVWEQIEAERRDRTLYDDETAAIEALRNIVSAQAMFQQAGLADVDEDGNGEFGGLLELSGTFRGRGHVPLAIPEFPPFEFGRTSGVGTLSGYCYRIYLPDASGAGVAEPPTGFTARSVNAERCEHAWCGYAWPVVYGASGTRTFFTSQAGDVLATDAPLYNGSDAGPVADAAFRDPGIVGPAAVDATGQDATGQDGTTWSPVD